MRDIIDRIPFIVTADLEMTDTASKLLIWYFLPAAHYYEVDRLSQASCSHFYVQF